jgi:hypothetical protein
MCSKQNSQGEAILDIYLDMPRLCHQKLPIALSVVCTIGPAYLALSVLMVEKSKFHLMYNKISCALSRFCRGIKKAKA